MEKVMAWVEKIGEQSWRVRHNDHNGRTQSVTGFNSEQGARSYATGLRPKPQPQGSADAAHGSATLATWTQSWLRTLRVSERTEENYRRNIRRHLLPRWGEHRLAAITATDIHMWVGQLHAAGYAPTTITTLVKLLSQILGDAVEAGLLSENPVRRRPHRGPRVIQPVAERIWATPEQVVQIAENATALGDATMGLLLVTAGWTGLRWGELAGLQRCNLHLADGVLLIDRYVGGLHESGSRMWLGPPKTNASVRVVSLPPFLIALLREHVERTDGVPVFAGPQGGWLRRSNVDRRVLRPATDGTLELPQARLRLAPVQPGLTFHGFRHSHKTWLIADGVPEIAQARRLGHHLTDRVVETYSHVAPEVEQRLLDGLEARWHAANAYLHPRAPQHSFRTLLNRVGHWRQAA
jgi:integrase